MANLGPARRDGTGHICMAKCFERRPLYRRPPPKARVSISIGSRLLERGASWQLFLLASFSGSGRANFSKSSAEKEADRKSTRLNSSHLVISYAVFCLKKKKQ